MVIGKGNVYMGQGTVIAEAGYTTNGDYGYVSFDSQYPAGQLGRVAYSSIGCVPLEERAVVLKFSNLEVLDNFIKDMIDLRKIMSKYMK